MRLPLLDSSAGGGDSRQAVWLAGLLLLGEWLIVEERFHLPVKAPLGFGATRLGKRSSDLLIAWLEETSRLRLHPLLPTGLEETVVDELYGLLMLPPGYSKTYLRDFPFNLIHLLGGFARAKDICSAFGLVLAPMSDFQISHVDGDTVFTRQTRRTIPTEFTQCLLANFSMIRPFSISERSGHLGIHPLDKLNHPPQVETASSTMTANLYVRRHAKVVLSRIAAASPSGTLEGCSLEHLRAFAGDAHMLVLDDPKGKRDETDILEIWRLEDRARLADPKLRKVVAEMLRAGLMALIPEPSDSTDARSTAFVSSPAPRGLLESEVASFVGDYLNLVEANSVRIPIWNGKIRPAMVPNEPARVDAAEKLIETPRKSSSATLRARLRQRELQRVDEAMELSQLHRGSWELFVAGFLVALVVSVLTLIVLTFVPLGEVFATGFEKSLTAVGIHLPVPVLRALGLALVAFLNLATLYKLIASAKPILNLPNTAAWSESWEALLWDSYAAVAYLNDQRSPIDLNISDLKPRCEAMVRTWRVRLLHRELRKHNKSGRIRNGEACGFIEALTRSAHEEKWERIEIPGTEEEVEAFLDLEVESDGKVEDGFSEAKRRSLAAAFTVGSTNGCLKVWELTEIPLWTD